MASTYAFDLAPVGPNMYSGWTPAGHYIVKPAGSGSGFIAVFRDRKGAMHKLGTFDKVRDAQVATQTDAMIRNVTRRGR